jgi:hypothetical protein
MKTQTIVGVIAALVVVGAAGYWVSQGMPHSETYTTEQGAQVAPTDNKPLVQSSMGTYSYQCDNGADMTMTPADDMSAVSIGPNGMQSQGKIPAVTLAAAGNAQGARFEGSGVVFVGAGEEITLTYNGQTVHCNPLANPDMAPFNWGDAGDGGGSAWPAH